MVAQADVERAAAAVMRGRHSWRLMMVHPSGSAAWTINYRTPARFLSVKITVDADTTEADLPRLIITEFPPSLT